MAAQGVGLDRSTLAGWAGQAAALLDPVASRAIAKKLLKAAEKVEGRLLHGVGLEDLEFAGGDMIVRDDPGRRVGLIQAMQAGGLDVIEAEETAFPG